MCPVNWGTPATDSPRCGTASSSISTIARTSKKRCVGRRRNSRAVQTATVGELAASIAHEVNQPLSAVVANANACLRWLSAEPPNFVKAQQAAERIVRDGKDAGEVVRRVRALFKRAALEMTPVHINEIIETATTAGARHFCGEAHAQVYISRWFDSVCSPSKPDFTRSASVK
jgi:signal transduction histidine kinase